MPTSRSGWLGGYITAILFLWPASGQAPSREPIGKDALLTVLRLCPSGADEAISGIQASGVDFRLTLDEEQTFLALKADSKLLDAIRANYRGPAAQVLPDGPPLAFGEVAGLLQAHRDHAWIGALIRKRGVDFPVTLQGGRTLVSAGASMELIGLIVLNQEESALAKGLPATASPSKPVQLTREELARRLRVRVAPEFPLQARRIGLYGSVVLEVEIDRTGALKAFGRVRGHPFLVDAAKNAVRRWQWEPTLINRVPMEVTSEVLVEFVKQ